MTTYKVYDICWDLDYEVDEYLLGLKQEYEVTIDFPEGTTPEEKEEVIMNKVSDKAGYCIFMALIEPELN